MSTKRTTINQNNGKMLLMYTKGCQLKARPMKKNESGNGYVQCDPKEATHIDLIFPLPYPLDKRMIPIQIGGAREGTNNWSWNGDTEKPTVKPSVLTKMPWGKDKNILRCHSFVNDGKVQFLNDCTHEFANMTLDLVDIGNS